MKHVRALDGLRGAAVAAVLLFHGGHLTGGYLGVDLFFVLSGFLITSLLLQESGSTGRIGLGAFWARRARRLLPAIGGLMVGVAGYCVVFASPTELTQIRGDALGTLGYVANWREVFASHDYFALFEHPSPLQHTWSLAIEEQFYLVWPLVFVGLLAWWKRAAPMAVLVVAICGAAVSSALMFVLYDPANVARAYYGTDTRATGILVGAAVAAALRIWGPARLVLARVLLRCAGGAGVAVLAVAWIGLSGQDTRLYRGGFVVVALAAAAVITIAVHPDSGLIARMLGWRPLCLLGLISYGAYLWHWPVYVVLDAPRTDLEGWALLAVRIGVTLAIAVLSFVFIEQPVRRGAGSAVAWRAMTPALAVLAVALLFVATAGARRPESAVAAGPSVESTRRAVHQAIEQPQASRILVVGNSVGWYLGRALAEVETSTSPVVLNGALPACVFPSGADAVRFGTQIGQQEVRDCDTGWNDDVARFHPDTVLFIYGWGAPADFHYGDAWLTPCTTRYNRFSRVELEAAIRRFQVTGARVVVATDAYAAVAAAFPEVSGTFLRNTDCANRVIRRAVRNTNADLADLFEFTCPDGMCRRRDHGVVLREDGIHYRDEGARIVARWILRQMSASSTPPTSIPSS